MNKADAAQLRERAHEILAQLANLEHRELASLLESLCDLAEDLVKRGDVVILENIAAAIEAFLRVRGVHPEPPPYVERLRATLRRIRAAELVKPPPPATTTTHDPNDTSMFDV